MSASSVITLGYGQGIGFVPTIGYASGVAAGVQLLGGGPGNIYVRHHEDSYQRTLAQRRIELERIDEEIADVEAANEIQLAKAKMDMAAKRKAKNAAKKLAALEASLQDDISVLRMERMRLMRLIDDEEAILVILLSMPLH